MFNLILEDSEIVPITGLTESMQNIMLFSVSILISLLFVYLFPRIFCPLFLKIKGIINKNYKNGYIETDLALTMKKKFISRSINCMLLTMGFMVLILEFLDPTQWLPGGQRGIDYYSPFGIPITYVMPMIITALCLIFPVAVGLWSISWQFEDAGLMHYNISEKPQTPLFEIEPIHVNFSSYLKGFGGISSIFFILKVAIAWATVPGTESRIDDVIASITLPVSIIILIIPAYFVYRKTCGKNAFVRKGISPIRKITENDLKPPQ